jgi:uncharacterized protein (TIGR03790 family)
LIRASIYRQFASFARPALRVAAAMVLATLSLARADDSANNAPPDDAGSTNAAPSQTWTFHPIILTNVAPQPFLEEHQEATPTPDERPALSLHDNGSTNAPDVVAPNSGGFSSSYQSSDSINWGDDLASHLLVVYNTNDADSKDLAHYYASRRNIPAERVLGISCPITEEITRKEYDETIRSPILTYLSVKNWIARAPREVPVGDRMLDLLMATRNDIWAIVLMRGVPLKIAQDPDDYFGMETKPELQTNAAAVDSELALLPVFGLPLGGFVPNIFYENQPGGIKFIGPDLARNMILVTRLDGPTVADVRRMIDDSIYAEQHRLAGLAVVDTRGLTNVHDGYTSGDEWLRGARDALVKDGWTVKFDDKPDLIPPTDPCNQVAIYLGWYAQDPSGPWFVPPTRFVRGAIAYHLHSFSAFSVRNPNGNWVGPLIEHGADATMGTVYEPFLALTPHEDIFARRLLAGDYFAAAAYASIRGLSWMVTVVGDPLYRPFLPTIDDALAQDSGHHTDQDDWLQLQKVRRGYEQGVIPGDPQRLADDVEVPDAGPVAHEGLGDLLLELKDPKADELAGREYLKAADEEIQPIDRIRLGLKLADFYSAHGQSAHAQAELDNLRDLYPNDAARFGVPSTLVPTSVPQPPPPPAQGRTEAPRLPQLPQLPKPTPGP